MLSLAKLPSVSMPAVQSEHYIYLNANTSRRSKDATTRHSPHLGCTWLKLKYVASNVYPPIGPTFPRVIAPCYQVTVLTSRAYLTSQHVTPTQSVICHDDFIKQSLKSWPPSHSSTFQSSQANGKCRSASIPIISGYLGCSVAWDLW